MPSKKPAKLTHKTVHVFSDGHSTKRTKAGISAGTGLIWDDEDPKADLISNKGLLSEHGIPNEFAELPLQDQTPADHVSKTFSKQQVEEEYSKLVAASKEYSAFLLAAVTRLEKLEGSIYSSSEDSFDRRQEMAEIKFELENIQDELNRKIDVNVLFKSERNTKNQVTALTRNMANLDKMADTIERVYNEVKPAEGHKFAAKNNTMFNRLLDQCLRFLNIVMSKFGFTKHAKMDVLADIKEMRQKHSGPKNTL